MKRLLLGPALVLPLLTLGFCGKTPQLPKVPEVVREIPLDDFKAFPPVPTMPTPAPVVKPQPKVKPHAPVGTHRRPSNPRVRVAPRTPTPPAQVEVDPLPPQQGPICIFPLSMIPNCTPQAAQ